MIWLGQTDKTRLNTLCFHMQCGPRGKESYPVCLVYVKQHLPHIIALQLKTEIIADEFK